MHARIIYVLLVSDDNMPTVAGAYATDGKIYLFEFINIPDVKYSKHTQDINRVDFLFEG